MKAQCPHRPPKIAFWLRANLVLVFWAVFGNVCVLAQVYEQRGQILYEKVAITVPSTYWWCGRQYTTYSTQYQYKEVLNYAKPDWRQQALTLIDKQKERESFESVLQTMGVQGLMAPKNAQYVQQQQQAPALYPSQTGNALGGFTSYEYSRYGVVAPFDVNKADERAHASADVVARMAAEVNAVAGNAVQGAIAVQRISSERVGAIAEYQEARALLKEVKEYKIRELHAEAELLKAAKPAPGESLSIQREESYSQTGHVPAGPNYPPNTGPPPPPTPGSSDGAALAKKYCGACHGKEKADPDGGFYFDLGIALSSEGFGATVLRVDPNAPEYRVDANGAPIKDANGNPVPFRMPPPNNQAPTVQERRLLVDFAKSLTGG